MRVFFYNAIIAACAISIATTSAIAQSSNAERQRQEQQRRADEQRRQAEARQQLEQQRRADEQRRQAEARQQQERQRRADEQRRQAEARQQQEQQRRAEEQRRQADENRKEVELRRQAEAQKQAEGQRRVADEQRRAEEQRRNEAERRRTIVKPAPTPQLGTVRGPTNTPAPRPNQAQPTATGRSPVDGRTTDSARQRNTKKGGPPALDDHRFEHREGNDIKVNAKPLEKTTLSEPSKLQGPGTLSTGGGTALSVPAGALIGSQLTGSGNSGNMQGNKTTASIATGNGEGARGQKTKAGGRPAVNCIRLDAKPSKDPKYSGQTMRNTCGERIHVIWCHSQSTHPGTKTSECGTKGRHYQQETLLDPGKVKENFYTLPGDATIYWGACFGGYGTTKETGVGKFECVK